MGVPYAGRPEGDSLQAVGLFVRTLPSCLRVERATTFESLLNDVAAAHLHAMAFACSDVAWSWAEGTEPGFGVVFASHRFDFSLGQHGHSRAFTYPESHFDLLVTLAESADGFELQFEYSEALTAGLVEELAHGLLHMAACFAAKPAAQVDDVGILDQTRESFWRKRLNPAVTPAPAQGTLASHWAATVKRHGSATALQDARSQLTYAQTDARATAIAAALAVKGIKHGARVGLLSERSVDYAVALLAIIKAGATYVPLDPSYPPSRLVYMAEAAGCSACLVLEDDAPELGIRMLSWPGLLSVPEAAGTFTAVAADAGPEAIAYVMFTSGSTGKPKGVKVTHRNVLRLVDPANAVPCGSHMRVLLTGSPSFDATTYEIWAPLLQGGSVSFVDKGTLLDGVLLRAAIEHYQPNTMWMTAPLFARHVEANPRLFAGVDHVIVGGDVVQPFAVSMVQAHTPEVTLVNGYGPTENTTFSTFHVIRQGHTGPLPVGRPIARSRAYVLDSGRHLLPPGALGELYVGGEGVAAGYLDGEQDKGRFIEHTWSDGMIERLYLTGDLATAAPDGTLCLHGRRDAQIKIRGLRVEPDEVSEALRMLAAVGKAHVSYRRQAEREGLVAFIVLAQGATLDEASLLAHLRSQLPSHMVPTYYAFVETIPLTENGKINEAGLPNSWQPLLGRDETASSAPPALTPSQQTVVAIWCEVLHLDTVGLDDDFFRLGGDSLKLVALATRLALHSAHRPTIPALYKASTPRDQAQAFVADTVTASQPAPAVETRLQATDAQARLVLLDRISGGQAPYLIPILLRLQGDVDFDRLGAAWLALGQRHEFLRSRFNIEGETVWLDPARQPPLKRLALAQDEVETTLADLLAGFCLEKGDMATATLLDTPSQSWLALVFHHAAFDGDSVETLLQDFAALHAGDVLAPPPAPLIDTWAALTTEPDNNSTRYWIDRLAHSTCEIQLPTNRSRGAHVDYRGSTTSAPVEPALDTAIQALAERSAVTPYMIWLAGALVTLGRYAQQDDLTIGTVSAGRTSIACEGVCGMFANTLPLRITLDESISFEALLADVRQIVLEGLEHQSFSFSDLVAAQSSHRQSWRNPLFNVMFSYTNTGELAQPGQGLHWRRSDWEYPFAKFDLTLFVQKEPGHSRIAMEVADGALSSDASGFLQHWLRVLGSLTATPEAPLKATSLIGEDERTLVLDVFNDTAATQRDTLLMHEPFEALARATPQACAVMQGDHRLSYLELDTAANRLAHALRSQGCQPGVPVMVMMDRSVQTVVAVIGVLKAGGYYVPVDPTHPAARLASIAESLTVRLLVTDAASSGQRCDFIETVAFDAVVCLDAQPAVLVESPVNRVLWADDVAAYPASQPVRSAEPTDLAYTIFTSGSTGRPKGVAIAHRRAVNLIDWVNDTWAVGPQDRLLFVTSLCFDLSVYDIFGSLAAGASVYVASTDDLRDPLRLIELLRDQAITFWDSAPAALQQVLQTASGSGKAISYALRLCFLSGDWVPTSLPGALRGLFPEVQLVVLGGATEATVWSNFFEVREDTSDWVSIPYGRPIRNARYYVLDEGGQPCPVGVPGRLFIGGQCLAEGYAQAPALTAERFIHDPFVQQPQARMYDTGDLALWRADGQMIFLGRRDHQVKVRGYRVEIGEVTHAVASHPAVNHLLVQAQKDPGGDLALVAHVVLNAPVSVRELTAFVSTLLPAYMVPTWFSFLDCLPVTVNGKFDRERLPSIRELMALQQTEQLLSPVEAEIHAHWCHVLGRDSVALDLAFHAAGGSSLLLVRLFSRLEEAFAGVFTIPGLFAMPTLREQAAHLQAFRASTVAPPLDDESDLLNSLLERVARNEIDIDAAMMQLTTLGE
ncbi:amino acid adenylation domain-containing protein [Pseudomonas sp. NFR09]|nr:amino acid adenylation domain-containing protein [Pseudomonas sp. NFR09]